MNIYISVDMEGVTGVSHRDQVNSAHRDYPRHRDQLAREVLAACEGALAAGAQRILVKDAHETGRNLDGNELPDQVELISGWSGHPLGMVQELSDEFDAAVFIGYHAPAGSPGNPLSHTLSTPRVAEMRLNGKPASEYLVCAHAAEMFAVPVVFASGDDEFCAHVAEHSPFCRTVATMRGVGPSVVARHPRITVNEIRTSVQKALQGDLSACRLEVPAEYRLEIDCRQPADAYGRSFYPAIELVDQTTLVYRTGDFFEILRALKFLVASY